MMSHFFCSKSYNTRDKIFLDIQHSVKSWLASSNDLDKDCMSLNEMILRLTRKPNHLGDKVILSTNQHLSLK